MSCVLGSSIRIAHLLLKPSRAELRAKVSSEVVEGLKKDLPWVTDAVAELEPQWQRFCSIEWLIGLHPEKSIECCDAQFYQVPFAKVLASRTLCANLSHSLIWVASNTPQKWTHGTCDTTLEAYNEQLGDIFQVYEIAWKAAEAVQDCVLRKCGTKGSSVWNL